jgi:DNA-binding CsgD family transcriptional regulator
MVFGGVPGSPPDPFLIGLSALNLLSAAAESRPLVCVIDDAHWLDGASAWTLAFVGRRLRGDRVALLFATRQSREELLGVPEITIGGLRPEDAHDLLRSTARFFVDEAVRERIVAETRGIPMALLELSRGLTTTQIAGGFGFLVGEASPGRVETYLERCLQLLPDESRRLLVLAAAEPLGDALLLWRAADGAGVPAAAADAAEAGGLVSIGSRVIFRHPLVRAVVYRSASAQERRAAHLALARATYSHADPDRRAWHLGAATAGPDEAVALELESSAGQARRRAGLAAAAAFFERSAAVSVDTDRRTDRALAGAQASILAGDVDTTLGLLATAEAGALDELQAARVERCRAEVALSQGHGDDATLRLLQTARKLEPLDPRLSRDTYLDAWSAAISSGFEPTGRFSLDAACPPAAPGAPSGADVLLDGLSLVLTDGHRAAAPLLRQAAVGFAGQGMAVDELLRWGWIAAVGALYVWDYESCIDIAGRAADMAREAGALPALGLSLNVMGQARAIAGDLEAAASLIGEAEAVTRATGTHVGRSSALYLAACSGDEGRVKSLIDSTGGHDSVRGGESSIGFGSLAEALVMNGRGRHGDAVKPARDASGDRHPLVATRGLTELVEGAVLSGEVGLARDTVERLFAGVDAGGGEWARGVEARSRALLAEADEAEELYREAIELLGRTRLRPELARAHLLYGEWLRRQDRRPDARVQLRAAHEQFMAVGMEAFVERSRAGLATIGERVRKHAAETDDELTAQERQIATLAREGLSNPEIAGRLFLSPRTIEWHLGKVFTKLGISSRRKLVDALPAPET